MMISPDDDQYRHAMVVGVEDPIWESIMGPKKSSLVEQGLKIQITDFLGWGVGDRGELLESIVQTIREAAYLDRW